MADSSQGAGSPQPLVYWWQPQGRERLFDLSGWPEEALGVLRSSLEQDGLAHSWQDGKLVVDAAHREAVAALLDDIVAASIPRLDSESDRTAYDLGDWPDYEIEVLIGALEEAGIVHEWTDDGELLVYEADEVRVDELFDSLDLRGPDPGIELDGEALTDLLTDLFVAADKLAHDAGDANALIAAHNAILEVAQLAVPYGMNPDLWQALGADAAELRRRIEVEAGATDGRAGLREPALGADADADADDAGSGTGVQLDGDAAIEALAARVSDRLRRLL